MFVSWISRFFHEQRWRLIRLRPLVLLRAWVDFEFVKLSLRCVAILVIERLELVSTISILAARRALLVGKTVGAAVFADDDIFGGHFVANPSFAFSSGADSSLGECAHFE